MKNSILIIFLFIISCKRENIEYYSNGKIREKYFINNGKIDGNYEEYFENGKIKLKHIFKNGVKSDSSIYFFKNKKIQKILYYLKNDTLIEKEFSNKGKIISIGKTYKNKMIGKWKFYKTNGNLDKIIEYINLCGVQYVNQGWYYDLNGKIVKKGSNYFSLEIKKNKFRINEIIDIKFHYNPLLSEESISVACISPKIKENFCNLNNERLDTIFSNKHNFEFKLSFSEIGIKNIRGFIREEYFYSNKGKFGERTIYINIPLLIEK